MLAVIRTDAASFFGTGHVVRCLTLADELIKSGNEVVFVCREHHGHLCELISNRGCLVHRLPLFNDQYLKDTSDTIEKCLGAASRQEDAIETSNIIKSLNRKPDWLIVDHYGIDKNWEEILNPVVENILVIDDLANREHSCHLLLDQNLVFNMKERYQETLPDHCVQMLGPQYALLHPIYAELHKFIPERIGEINRILIYFGGNDSLNLTGMAINAILDLDCSDIDVDVIVHEHGKHANAIYRQCESYQNIHIHSNLPHLAQLMSVADLAIGAGGTTSWERLCLGLPALVVNMADNQLAISDGLKRNNLIKLIGDQNNVDVNDFKNELSPLLKSGIDLGWSQKCKHFVDGLGAKRVCAAMSKSSEVLPKARQLLLNDQHLLAELLSDIDNFNDFDFFENRSPSVFSGAVFESLRQYENFRFYLLEIADGVCVGFVQFTKSTRGWEINYYVSLVFCQSKSVNEILNSSIIKFKQDVADSVRFYQFNNVLDKTNVSSGSVSSSVGICTEQASWINNSIPDFILDLLKDKCDVVWSHDAKDVHSVDHCFYLSYGNIVNKEILDKNKHNIVVHESDLPKGRGWSPLTWQVLEGSKMIPVTLFEAAVDVDSGKIYSQEYIELTGDELVDELRALQKDVTFKLCKEFIQNTEEIVSNGKEQIGEPTYYQRRTPIDSEIDLDRPIREQFNLFRVSDNNRYPIWFEINGVKYLIRINKINV